VSLGNGDQGTRIDFVLWIHSTPWWLLAECKRVNPAYGEWLFLKARYIRRDPTYTDRYIVEYTDEAPGPMGDLHFHARGKQIAEIHSGFYHIGIEVKTNDAGDSRGGSLDGIEKAASQVFRGVNGMVNYLKGHRSVLGTSRQRILVPVIFTTARLYAGTVNFAEVDLPTGELDRSKLQLEEVPYLYYQYHLSPGLQHQVYSGGVPFSELSFLLQAEAIRTVAIVNAEGINRSDEVM
jgi:hypothetical protein